MMTNEKLKQLTRKVLENPNATQLLWQLEELAENEKAVIVSQNALAKMLGVTRRTIQNRLDWLEKNELINIYKIASANVYELTIEEEGKTPLTARVITDSNSQKMSDKSEVQENPKSKKQPKSKETRKPNRDAKKELDDYFYALNDDDGEITSMISKATRNSKRSKPKTTKKSKNNSMGRNYLSRLLEREDDDKTESEED